MPSYENIKKFINRNDNTLTQVTEIKNDGCYKSLPDIDSQYSMAFSPQVKHPSGMRLDTSDPNSSQPPFAANSVTHESQSTSIYGQ